MKLLNRTIRTYLLYSFILLLITIPIFYLVVKRVLLHSVDWSLRTQVRDIRSNLSAIKSVGDLAIWSKLDKDIQLEPSNGPRLDAIYTDYKHHPHHFDDHDPIRKLDASILVGSTYYTLTVSTSLVENEDLLGSIVAVEIALMIALLGGLLWINQRISKRIWTPFYGTLEKIQGYELSQSPDLRLDGTDIVEFRDLNRSITNLVQKNYKIYQAQREFTENASHEMQTPLAIFQSQLEILMQSQPLSEHQAGTIQSIEMNIQRLSRINRSLLLLAKLDNREFQPTELIDIREILEKFLTSYHQHIEEKRLTVACLGWQAVFIRANRSLVEVLISNLISNAARHNYPNGQIEIGLDQHKLSVTNTGTVRSLETEKLFHRFNKVSSATEGNGLGLAIIKKITEVSDFEIQYRFYGARHSFDIYFKAANA